MTGPERSGIVDAQGFRDHLRLVCVSLGVDLENPVGLPGVSVRRSAGAVALFAAEGCQVRQVAVGDAAPAEWQWVCFAETLPLHHL